jgi:hypothetical protein
MNYEGIRSIYKSNESFLILCDFVKSPVDKQKLMTTFSGKDYIVPHDLEKETQLRIEDLKKQSRIKNFVFFDDHIARLDNWNYCDKILKLSFSRTTYFQFAALNIKINELISTLTNKRSLKEYLNEKTDDIRNSKLPNPLSANVSIILEKELQIVLSKHSSKNLESPNVLTNPIGGTVSIEQGDVDIQSTPNPFKTIIRESKEEMGLDLSDNDIIFLGLGRNLINLKPEIYGQVKIQLTKKELMESWKTSRDSFESDELVFVDIHNDSIIEFMQNNSWSPIGWITTIASCLNYLNS